MAWVNKVPFLKRGFKMRPKKGPCYCGDCFKCREYKNNLKQRKDWWHGPMVTHGYGV